MRRGAVAATDAVGVFLDLPLPAHPAENAFVGEIGGIHRHQQRRVGVFPVPVGIAHAVGNHPAFLAGRRHHVSSRTHAEGVHRLPVQMLHQLIIRQGQGGIFAAVLGDVDVPLPVLDAHAHGEGLRLHGNAGSVQHFKGIPGAVSDGQHRPVTGNDRPVGDFQSDQTSILRTQAGDLGVEPHLAALGDDAFAQILHHGQQHVGALMGLGVVENVLPRSRRHKLFQNPADSGIVDPGVQLAVRKGSRAALAELDVAFRVQLASLEEFFHLGMAGRGVLSPFQHQRLPARQRQNQRGKHASGAESHHHRPLFRRTGGLRRLVPRHRGDGRPLAAALLQYLLFAAIHGHVDGVNNAHVGLFSGVHTPPDDPHAPDSGVGDAQHPRRLKGQLVGAVFRRQGNIA